MTLRPPEAGTHPAAAKTRAGSGLRGRALRRCGAVVLALALFGVPMVRTFAAREEPAAALSRLERSATGQAHLRPSTFRRDLARVGWELLHRPAGAERDQLLGRFRALSAVAYQRKHGVTVGWLREMERIEAAMKSPEAVHAERDALAALGWELRRVPSGSRWRAAWDRWFRATSLAQYLYGAETDVRRPGYRSAVEAETRLTDAMLARMVPSDPEAGLRPMLAAVGLLPAAPGTEESRALRDEALKQAVERLGQKLRAVAARLHVPLEKLSWERLGKENRQLQRGLLVLAVAATANFHGDRAIPFVTFAPPKRKHRADTARTGFGFLPLVELKSHEDAVALEGIELHHVGRGPAGANTTQTFERVKSMGGDMHHEHVHLVRRPGLPAALYFYGPEGRKLGPQARERTEAAIVTDHWRRANLYFDLRRAAYMGVLERRTSDSLTYYDYTSAEKLGRLYNHLAYGTHLRASELKMGTVGYRVAIYRNEQGMPDGSLEGYELRSVRDEAPQKDPQDRATREAAVNAIQRSLITGHYGLPPSALVAWCGELFRANYLRGPVEDRLAALHYNRPFGKLWASAPAFVKGTLASAEARTRLEEATQTNLGARLLLHDWKHDTTWLGLNRPQRVRALERVHRAQRAALVDVARGVEVDKCVRRFVRESGLVEEVGRSLGIPDLRRVGA
ncbi:MAG: hypothetical protein IT371_08180 [Deltaproteobacteria bacterium]|nr:hypothetical protein [Deltaproteobacteria bacterium]